MADPNYSLKIHVDGSVSADDFKTVVDAMVDLLKSLTARQSPGAELDWVVTELGSGSASVGFSPITETVETLKLAQAVQNDYEHLAEVAQYGNLNEFSNDIADPMQRLTSIISQRNPRVQFITDNSKHDVIARIDPAIIEEIDDIPVIRFHDHVRTAIKGRIVNVSDKKDVEFTLEESHTGRKIRCFPPNDVRHRQWLADLWAQKSWIIVEGTIGRGSNKGAMKDITDIVSLDDSNSGGWRQAIGCAPLPKGGSKESSADVVQRLRDGE